jgi:pimeloyl-ACP methyl ester carboxylesterase
MLGSRHGRLLRWTLAALAAAFVLLNGLAYRQVQAMSHVAARGEAVPRLEDLHGLEKLKVLLTGATAARADNSVTPASLGLPFKTSLIPGGSTETLEVWELPSSGRHWVLMFHGYRSSKSALLEDAQAFHRKGWNCLMVDLPAHGGSSGDSTSIGYNEGKDVAKACDYARHALKADKIVLFGVSMGAASILRGIGRNGVQADAIILEAPFDRFSDTVKNRFRLMGLPSFPAAQALLFWASLQIQGNAYAYRLSDEAARVRCPSLVLAGEEDQRAPVTDAEAVSAAIQGPQDLVIFKGAGHESFLKSNPELWNQKVDALLKQV